MNHVKASYLGRMLKYQNGLRTGSIVILLLLITSLPGIAQHPNIIFIMTDDMGYGDLGCYGNTKFATPNLDKLARQGTRFLNAYSAAPVCTPTRTALMTGLYPAKLPVGLMEPLRSPGLDSAYGLTSAVPSLGTLMKGGGYETVLIGKWHLGFMPHQSPTRNGFDYFFGIHSGGADYISHKGENRKRDYDLYENDNLIYTEGYLTDLFTKRSVAFIKQNHEKPFFLLLTYNAPHWPWQAPTDPAYPDSVDFSEGGSPATYAAMMKSLDDGIGEILKALDESSLANQTIVCFTNDNGGERYSDNGGLAQGKMTLWEGGIRVPAIIRWPGRIDSGKVTEQVATTMDWTVTMLKAAGVDNRLSHRLDGMDLMPVLTRQTEPKARTLYWRTFQRTKHKAVRDGYWKYLKDEHGEYLFDLRTDPMEKNDLKTKELQQLESMKSKLAAWEKTLLTPIPL